jgi:oligopeptide/dipeptide ABC transporter ATP-binding protein
MEASALSVRARFINRNGRPLLEVRDLVKQFPLRDGHRVLTAVSLVSFAIWPGETLALVGESGSGKTTVGRCVLGLLPVTSGEIWFDGHEIARKPQKQLRPFRPRMQVVFQDPFDSLNPVMRVGRIIEEPFIEHVKGSTSAERSEKVVKLLERVGLNAGFLERFPDELTAGQQQHVAIARALATNPKLLILDEPTSTLDPIARAEIMRLFAQLQQDAGMSLLFISHDLVGVRHLAHRVAVMYLGEIVEEGPVDRVYERPSHPYTRALLSLAPSIERRLAGDQVRVELSGEIPSPINLPQGCYLASRCPFVLEGCLQQRPTLEAIADGHLSRCLRQTGKLPPLGGNEPTPLKAESVVKGGQPMNNVAG